MRILVETTPDYLNMGDLAMLRVAHRRIRQLWPDAQVWAITQASDRLRSLFPDILPTHAVARDLAVRSAPGVRGLLGRWSRAAFLRPPEPPASVYLVRDFLRLLKRLDLYVIAGMGSFTSAFEPAVLPMIKTAPLVRAHGVPTVAFSQGLGPFDRSGPLWRTARRAVPSFAFVGLREGRQGPLYLSEFGLSADRYEVTGDDAVELAYERRTSQIGHGIGFSLRATRYAGLPESSAQQIARVVSAMARQWHTEVLSTPVSHVPEESDVATFGRLFHPTSVEPTPEWLIGEVGRCRFVITGAYHAAVFALAQGIPAVCIANSEYYRDKFLGLRFEFGDGCRVLDVSWPDFAEALSRGAKEFWHGAAGYRDGLLAQAKRQVEASRSAWASLGWRVSPRRGAKRPPVEPSENERLERYHRRLESMSSQLNTMAAYLQHVEGARDWYRRRAASAEAELRSVGERESPVRER